MSLSLFDASIATFLHTLRSLQNILEKGVAHAEARKFDPNVLATLRLYPDMLPLNRQVQIASDAAKGAAARLSATEPPQFEGADSRVVTVKSPRNTFNFTAVDYVRHWALPNFFFHVTMTYALLRHGGVEIGKADYLGSIPQA